MLDFRIYTFLTVCRFMNYTKAAQELCLTQPAVSQHIHYLEKQYGTPLFKYSGKTLSLTESGEKLLRRARALAVDEELLREELQEKPEKPMLFTFGVTTTIGEFVIARPFAHFRKTHPDIHIRMTMANTKEFLRGLREGTVSFALIEGYFPTEEFSSLVYSSEEFIPVCNAAHQFAEEPETLQQLTGEHLIVREPGSGTRNILEKALDIRNIRMEEFAETTEISSMYTIVQLLMEDCGISFLYKTAVQNELEKGVLKRIPLTDFRLKHDFSFIWNKGSLYSETYRMIYQNLKDGRAPE